MMIINRMKLIYLIIKSFRHSEEGTTEGSQASVINYTLDSSIVHTSLNQNDVQDLFLNQVWLVSVNTPDNLQKCLPPNLLQKFLYIVCPLIWLSPTLF